MVSLIEMSKKNLWELKMGASQQKNGQVTFSLWAPYAKSVAVEILENQETAYPMTPLGEGYFEITLEKVPQKCDYLYLLDHTKERPDPVSRFQPYGVHGPSRVVNKEAFSWADDTWKGLNLKEFIIYECHTGTFTPEGTFEAIIPKLPYLKDLGVTAIELMPVAEFPGNRNWGYDGAYPYAPQSTYGGPNGLKTLINACHKEGIAVILDVVYNHLGPEGNYLGEFGPYFTDRYKTPWGEAINYDGQYSDWVRRYIIENALYWLTEYHIDALRLDAIHAIFDFSAKHLLQELHEQFQQQAKLLGKKAWIIAESDLNDTRLLKPKEQGGYAIDAQWSDDFHHAQHTLFLGKRNGYFGDFGTIADLKKAITSGFVNDGRWSQFRKRKHGTPSKDLPGEQFVIFTQNHDQIANACRGDRSGTLLTLEQQKVTTALLLFTPNIPLLFMGQEWGETNPFLYFTSHADLQLAQAVRAGYQRECADFAFHGHPIDPQDVDIFLASKLDWEKQNQSPYKKLLTFTKDALAIRKSFPCLSNCNKNLTEVYDNEEKKWLIIVRQGQQTSSFVLICNLSSVEQKIPFTFPQGNWKKLLDSNDPRYSQGTFSPSEEAITSDGHTPCNISLSSWSLLALSEN